MNGIPNKIFILLNILVIILIAGCNFSTSSRTQPAIITFHVNPDKIISGQSSTLSWEVANAKDIKIDPGLSHVEPKGILKISPVVNTAYTISAINEYGTQQKTIWITVEQPSQKIESGDRNIPVINLFSAKPDKIWPGAVSRLSWDVSNATTITIIDGHGNKINENSINKGDIILRPVVNTSFLLIAENKDKVVTSSIKIEINNFVSGGDAASGGNGGGGCGCN